MSSADVTVETRRPRKRIAKGPPRPKYLGADDIDRVFIMMTTVLSELLTVRDRVDTLEHLLDRDGILANAAVEDFRPSAEMEQAREAQHLAILRRVYRVLQDEFEDYDAPIPQ